MNREWWADGPADDPDECGLDAISEDEDFQESFVTANAGRLIDLIQTPDIYPTLLAAKTKKLKAKWYAAQDDELKNRRDV